MGALSRPLTGMSGQGSVTCRARMPCPCIIKTKTAPGPCP